MELITLNPVFLHRKSETEWDFQSTSDCKFQVSIDGGPMTDVDSIPLLGTGILKLPDSPRPLPLTIRANPTSSRFWPVQANFEYQGGGNLVPKLTTDDSDPDVEDQAFQPPTSVRFPASLPASLGGTGGATACSMQVYLSRVRVVTTKVRELLRNVPPQYAGFISPVLQGNAHYVSDRILDDSRKLEFDSLETVDLDVTGTTFVFEVAGVPAPKLIGCSWPDEVFTHQFADPTSFLIFFHPHLGQAAADYAPFPYPFGWSYLFWVLIRDLLYLGDPLTELPGPKGIAYQRAFSKKKVVSLVPVPSVAREPEMGAFVNAEEMEDLGREIQAFMFRRNRVYEPPGLKRVAVGAFSNGCGIHMFNLLKNNRDHSFLRLFVKELYLFDPRMKAAELANECLHWVKDDPAHKHIRVYMTNNDAAYASIIDPGFTYPQVPFLKNTDDGLRTLLSTGISDWVRAAATAGATKAMQNIINAFGPVHELHPGTLLTHALKHSGFD